MGHETVLVDLWTEPGLYHQPLEGARPLFMTVAAIPAGVLSWPDNQASVPYLFVLWFPLY